MWGRFRGVAAVVAVMAAVLVACGVSPPPGDERPAGQSAPDLTEDPGTASASMLVRVTGTVANGAPGCLMLETPGERYILIGGDPNLLEPDDEVTVTGTADPNAPTNCTDGVPLTVSEVIPVE